MGVLHKEYEERCSKSRFAQLLCTNGCAMPNLLASPLLGGCSSSLVSDVETTRAIRSTITMMGYLARNHAAPVRPGSALQRPSTASAAGQNSGTPARGWRPQSAAAASDSGASGLHGLSADAALRAQLHAAQIQQVARQTHAVAGDEYSARVLETELVESVASLGCSLIAHARARAADEAAAMAACQHRRQVGEARARGMGAVAPHRNAAQVAALAIGGPALQAQLSPSPQSDRPSCPSRAAGCAAAPSARDAESLAADCFTSACVPPGSYLLRSWAARQAGGGPTGDRVYVSGAVRLEPGGALVPALGSYAVARATPVRVRATDGKGGGAAEAAMAACARTAAVHAGMPSRLHAGASAYATLTIHKEMVLAGPDGRLTLGVPRTREDAQFVLLALPWQEVSALEAEEAARSGAVVTGQPSLPPLPAFEASPSAETSGVGTGAGASPACASASALAPEANPTAAPPRRPSSAAPSVALVRLLHVSSGKLVYADPSSALVFLAAPGRESLNGGSAAWSVFEVCMHRRPVTAPHATCRHVGSAPLVGGRVGGGRRACDKAIMEACALGAGRLAGMGAVGAAEAAGQGGGDAGSAARPLRGISSDTPPEAAPTSAPGGEPPSVTACATAEGRRVGQGGHRDRETPTVDAPPLHRGGRWGGAAAEAGPARILYAREWEASPPGAAPGRPSTAGACVAAWARPSRSGRGSLGDSCSSACAPHRAGHGCAQSANGANSTPTVVWCGLSGEDMAVGCGMSEVGGASVAGLVGLGPAKLDLKAVSSHTCLRRATSTGVLSPSRHAPSRASTLTNRAAAPQHCGSTANVGYTLPTAPVGYTLPASSAIAMAGMRRLASPAHGGATRRSASATLGSPQPRWRVCSGDLAPTVRVGSAPPPGGWPAAPGRLAAVPAAAAPDDLSALIASWATRRTGRLPEHL